MAPTTTTEKKPIILTLEIDPNDSNDPAKVILFNCNCHTFDAVILQITRAIQCTQEKAMRLAEQADTTGQATIFEGPRKRCEKVADMLASIGLKVVVEE